jgi:hypothetical protein
LADLRVFALSALTDPFTAAAGREAGFSEFLAKMERESLIANLRACLEEPVAV